MNKSGLVYYFAYGSNMNPERMIERGARFTSMAPYTLDGYVLRFNKASRRIPGAGFANIVPSDGGAVEGVLYEIDIQGLHALDRHEGYPTEYGRIMLELEVDGIQRAVKTYIAKPDKTLDTALPTKVYLRHLLAAKDFLSEQYFAALMKQDTLD